ncbi:Methionine--tRNA ligase [Bertholletia excelsa]
MAILSKSTVVNRNFLIVSALCKRLGLNASNFQVDKDIKSLCGDILTSVQGGNTFGNNDEAMKWVAFAENFPVDSEASLKALNELNERLATKSVLAGDGMTPSESDIIVFSSVYSFVKGLSDSNKNSLPHLIRWMDYIQNKEFFGDTFEQILVEKDSFEPPIHVLAPKITEKVEADTSMKMNVRGTRDAKSGERGSSSKRSVDEEKVIGAGQLAAEQKKLPEKIGDDKDKDISISLLKIQVGHICRAWKHPSADSLLVEEIDTGDAKLRQVVSGLAKYCSPDELTNRRVVLITNVKPGKLRDVMSEGLVLCASNEDHSIVEPLTPPKGAKVGECVTFSGHDGKPEDVLNPKKKQLEKITPHLFTDDKGVATFKGIPFMTSGGPCISSIPKASIK